MIFNVQSNGDFQFAPNQGATRWDGTAPRVIETITFQAVEAIVIHLAKNNPQVLKKALILCGHNFT